MIDQLLLALVLMSADAPAPPPNPADALEAVVGVPKLAQAADLSFLLQNWAATATAYQRLVDANPTIGLFWHRLGISQLETGKYAEAVQSLQKAEQLGAFQLNPVRPVYHGESAWGIAAAHARLRHADEAREWTRKSLTQGLRDIRRFHSGHFEELLKDPDYRKLVWAIDQPDNLSRDEGYRLDLRFLLHEAKRIHFAPFHATSESSMDALAAKLDADIPNLNDDQVFVRFMGIVRQFHDGHTNLHRGRIAALPIELYLFPEGLFVVAAAPAYADLVGAHVLRIGDKSADEALGLAEDIAARDADISARRNAPWLLRLPSILRGLGILSGEGPVGFEIKDAAGQSRRVEVSPPDKPTKPAEWVRKVPGRDQSLPLSARDPARRQWFEKIPNQRVIYCQINAISGDLSGFSTKLFNAINDSDVEALILDLRYNGGGDTFTNPPLIEGLIRCDKLRQPGRLFLIIGRGTYSAAINTTTEIERRTKAILVGEPTVCPPNFIGENVSIQLPYSGWTLSVSDMWWQHSMPMDYRVWTAPTLYAPPTAAAFLTHRDPALETIFRYRAAHAAPPGTSAR